MKKLIVTVALAAALPVLVSAQPSAHYVPGVEGIKGSTLPPPGIYARDYNVFYYSDRLNDSHGNEVPGIDPEVFTYANVPRVLWITDKKLLGGYIGFDALVPLKYTDFRAGPTDKDDFSVGDVFFESTLSWHLKHFDFAYAYGAWAPTGDYSRTDPTRAGSGFWTHMFTAAATWFPDQEKKVAVSALSRYEISNEQDKTHNTPGQAYTLEWGVSYAVAKTVDVGVVGYWQLQTTKDKGPTAVNTTDQVVGVGPEISAVWAKPGIIFSLRYLYEVVAEDRFQGHTGCLTLTKRL